MSQDVDDARELLDGLTDPAERETWRAELADKEAQLEVLEGRIKELLLPHDPNEGRNVIVEIQGTEGGEEANLWAGDLYRMYQHFAERNGLKIEVLSSQPSEHGGYRDITFVVKGDDAWSRLQVRGWSAPRAAGARDREPGSDPYERGDGRGAARGRGHRRRDRSERSRDRCLPRDRTGRAVGEHDRLRGADHAQADRSRRLVPGREEPAAEQGQGDAHPAFATAAGRTGSTTRRSRARRGAIRSRAAAGPRRSARTTTRRTGSPITGSRSRCIHSIACSRASSTMSSMRSRPTNGPGSSAANDRGGEDVAGVARRRPRSRWRKRAFNRRKPKRASWSSTRRGTPRRSGSRSPSRNRPRAASGELHEMLKRRVAGEPLQYVLGGWEFRGLDLFVDRRVLIPRPETEYVVEVALEEAARSGLRRSRRRLSLVESRAPVSAADIGTGSGAIAIALAAELPDVEVWATDVSDDALAVARANVAGCAATRVRIAPAGEWFDPLPARAARLARAHRVESAVHRRARGRGSSRRGRGLRAPARAGLGSVGNRSDRATAGVGAPTGSRRVHRSCARSRRTRPARCPSARVHSDTPRRWCATTSPVGPASSWRVRT